MKNTKVFGVLFALVCVAMTVFSLYSVAAYAHSEEVVRVACGSDKLLWTEDGELQGICAEYLKKLEEVNHWKIEYVDATWTESMELLEAGKIDLLFPAQITVERNAIMDFSKLQGGYQQIILLAAEEAEIYYEDYENFNGKRIGITKGSYNEEALDRYAENHNFTYEKVYLNSSQDKLEAFENGTIDLAVNSALSDTQGYKVVAAIELQPFYYAVKKGNDDLLNRLDEGMEKILAENAKVVREMEDACIITANQYPALTKEESDYMREKGKVIVGFYNHIEPLAHSCSVEGELEGVFDTLLRKLEELSGMKFEAYLIGDTEYGPDLIEDGTIDFFVGQISEGSDAESMGFSSSMPLISSDIVLISRSKFQFQKEDKVTLALTKGRDYWQSIIDGIPSEVEVQYFNTSKECLLAVNDGIVDLTVLNSMEFNYQSKNERFMDLIEWGNFRYPTDVVLMASKDENPLMISIINKFISKIPEEDVQDIVNYHMNLPYHSEDWDDKLYSMQEGLIIAGVVTAFSILLVSIVFWVRRQSFRVLEEKNAQLQKANQVKLDFLSNMSHEMRTPINVILGLTELVMDETEKESVRNDLQKIKGAGRLLLTQINDVLDITKIEQAKIVLKPEPYWCMDFVEQIHLLIEPLAKKKNQNLLIDVSKAEGGCLFVDKVRFNQIFFNLLSNAVKYTPEHGTIELLAETVERTEITVKHRFTVRDTGIGMSEEFLAHIGEPFVREDNETTKLIEGSGLGIYIVKQLIYSMNGKMTVESILGKGTTFVVELETRNKNNFPQKVMEAKENLLQVKEEKSFAGFRALVCEDHPVNAKIAAGFLRKAGVEVELAANGESGFQKIRNSEEGTFDIIFMDIRMPVMDGLEAATLIRKENRQDCKTIPIIAMTANAFAEDKEKSRAAGMDDHLVKPLEVEELYKILAKYLSDK